MRKKRLSPIALSCKLLDISTKKFWEVNNRHRRLTRSSRFCWQVLRCSKELSMTALRARRPPLDAMHPRTSPTVQVDASNCYSSGAVFDYCGVVGDFCWHRLCDVDVPPLTVRLVSRKQCEAVRTKPRSMSISSLVRDHRIKLWWHSAACVIVNLQNKTHTATSRLLFR